MSKVTETNLAELKDFLAKKFETLEAGQKTIESGQRQIENRLIRLEEKVEGINTRLSILESKTTLQINWFLGIITAVFAGLLTAIFRFFPSNT